MKSRGPNVIAGKMGAPFIQSSSIPVDMKTAAKGNLQGAREKRASKIVPSRGANWGGSYTKQVMGPPSSANWRATTRPMPTRPLPNGTPKK